MRSFGDKVLGSGKGILQPLHKIIQGKDQGCHFCWNGCGDWSKVTWTTPRHRSRQKVQRFGCTARNDNCCQDGQYKKTETDCQGNLGYSRDGLVQSCQCLRNRNFKIDLSVDRRKTAPRRCNPNFLTQIGCRLKLRHVR